MMRRSVLGSVLFQNTHRVLIGALLGVEYTKSVVGRGVALVDAQNSQQRFFSPQIFTFLDAFMGHLPQLIHTRGELRREYLAGFIDFFSIPENPDP